MPFKKRQSGNPNGKVPIIATLGETRVWSGSAFDFDAAVKAAQGTYNSMMTFGGLRSG